MRETKFSIVKALAIILVVMSHAGISGWLYNFVFLFHVPVFFLCAGYFFHTRYLDDERTFLVHRIKGLYLPFLRWSVFFLVVHNLLFYCGLLSETYGNAQGGVTHPFTWHQFGQHLWSIVANMSGYDPFLCGTFWFFRALLLSSVAFLILFKLLQRSEKCRDFRQCGWGILIISLFLAAWQVGDGLTLTGVAQGGYRELMGVAFMAAGFLLRQYGVAERITWRTAAPALLLVGLAAQFFPTSMVWRATFRQFLSLPLPAMGGFLLLVYAAKWIDRLGGILKRGLIYIGDRTLYVFAFHLLAFKVVSAVKVAWYGLPWEAVGGHPVVHSPANNVLWIIFYVLVGVSLPLLWVAGYRLVAANVTLTQCQVLSAVFVVAQRLCRIVAVIGRTLWAVFMGAVHSFCQGVKEIIAASSPKNE